MIRVSIIFYQHISPLVRIGPEMLLLNKEQTIRKTDERNNFTCGKRNIRNKANVGLELNKRI